MKTRKALGASRNMLQHGVALLAATTCLAALAETFTATAATCTWTGGGDGSTWNDTDNWENGVKPTSGQGDAVVLSGKVGGSEIQNDMGAISVAKITFTGGNAVTFSSPSVVTLVGDSSRRVLQMDASGTVTVSARDRISV